MAGVADHELGDADRDRPALEEIPVLDLAGYLDGSLGEAPRLAAALRDAQERIGFFYVRNHGVAQDLIDAMFDQTARFHAQPLAAKQDIRIRRAANRLCTHGKQRNQIW